MNSEQTTENQQGLRVLSLYDGMSCGLIALLTSGVPVERYVAYENDPYAIQTSSHNFAFIEHRGDIMGADFLPYVGFDLLVGGSPCTYWSVTKRSGREVEASGLGWELFLKYVEALVEVKPRFFIYENNKSMARAIRETITDVFGFEPICINSSLVSAQNRERLYWVGRLMPDGTYQKVDIVLPEDRNVKVHDVINCRQDSCCTYPLNVTEGGKAFAIKANYFKSSLANFTNGGGHYPQTGVLEQIAPLSLPDHAQQTNSNSVFRVENGMLNVNGRILDIATPDGYYIIRKLTVLECKRLQTIPDWYEFPVSDTRAYKMIGNGWTVAVISHIVQSLRLVY